MWLELHVYILPQVSKQNNLELTKPKNNQTNKQKTNVLWSFVQNIYLSSISTGFGQEEPIRESERLEIIPKHPTTASGLKNMYHMIQGKKLST